MLLSLALMLTALALPSAAWTTAVRPAPSWAATRCAAVHGCIDAASAAIPPDRLADAWQRDEKVRSPLSVHAALPS